MLIIGKFIGSMVVHSRRYCSCSMVSHIVGNDGFEVDNAADCNILSMQWKWCSFSVVLDFDISIIVGYSVGNHHKQWFVLSSAHRYVVTIGWWIHHILLHAQHYKWTDIGSFSLFVIPNVINIPICDVTHIIYKYICIYKYRYVYIAQSYDYFEFVVWMIVTELSVEL